MQSIASHQEQFNADVLTSLETTIPDGFNPLESSLELTPDPLESLENDFDKPIDRDDHTISSWDVLDDLVDELSPVSMGRRNRLAEDVDFEIDHLTGLALGDEKEESLPLIDSNNSPLFNLRLLGDPLSNHALPIGSTASRSDLSIFNPSQDLSSQTASLDSQAMYGRKPLDSFGIDEISSYRTLDLGSFLDSTADLGNSRWFADSTSYGVLEDQDFTINLSELFPIDDQIQSLDIVSDTASLENMLSWHDQDVDASLSGYLAIEALWRDELGQEISSSDWTSIEVGSALQLDIVVTDNRADRPGVLGLELDLEWDEDELSMDDIALSTDLPLFRSIGIQQDDSLVGLSAASLPKGGAGGALGDTVRDYFASLDFTLLESLGGRSPEIEIDVVHLPSTGKIPVDRNRVLVLDSNKPQWSVLQGFPPQDEVGTHVLMIMANYLGGETWSQLVNINIENVNDAPYALSDTELLVREDSFSDFNLYKLFDDPDLAHGDDLTFYLTDQSDSNLPRYDGWLSIDANTGTLRLSPSVDHVGNWQIPIQAIDQSGLIAAQSVDLTVEALNDRPVYVGDEIPTLYLKAEESFEFFFPNRLFFDEEDGHDLILSLDQQGIPLIPQWFSFDTTQGKFEGQAPDSLPGPLSLQLHATDSDGLFASTSIQVELVDDLYNRSPYVRDSFPTIHFLDEDERFELHLNDIFADDDTLILGDYLNFDINGPDWLRYNSVDQVVFGTPSNLDVGSHDVSITAFDRHGADVSLALEVEVNNINTAPDLLVPLHESKQINSGETLSIDLDRIFDDQDGIHGDWLSYGLSIDCSFDESLPAYLDWDSSSGQLTLQPDHDDSGSLRLTFSATDLSGSSEEYQLDVLIGSEESTIEPVILTQDIYLRSGDSVTLKLDESFPGNHSNYGINYRYELSPGSVDKQDLTPVSTSEDWILLRDSTQLPTDQDSATVTPTLRLKETNESITAAEVNNLEPGTELELSIDIHDSRPSVDPGLIGLDLQIDWQGLELVHSSEALLETAMTDAFPLFRSTDSSQILNQSLRFTSAALPNLYLGEPLGVDGNTSFLTLDFITPESISPSQSDDVVIDLTLNEETKGGLGFAFADGETHHSRLSVIDLSDKPIHELVFHPIETPLGLYSMKVFADSVDAGMLQDYSSDFAITSVQTFNVVVGSGFNEAPIVLKDINSLPVESSSKSLIPLSDFFYDPDSPSLDYRLELNSDNPDDISLLRDSVRIIYRDGVASLEISTPELNRDIAATVAIVASDGANQQRKLVDLNLQADTQISPASALNSSSFSVTNPSEGVINRFQPVQQVSPHSPLSASSAQSLSTSSSLLDDSSVRESRSRFVTPPSDSGSRYASGALPPNPLSRVSNLDGETTQESSANKHLVDESVLKLNESEDRPSKHMRPSISLQANGAPTASDPKNQSSFVSALGDLLAHLNPLEQQFFQNAGKALSAFFDTLIDIGDQPSAMFGLMVGLFAAPSLSHHGIHGLVTSNIATPLAVKRRNQDLRSTWPVVFSDHQAPFYLSLVHGRLSLTTSSSMMVGPDNLSPQDAIRLSEPSHLWILLNHVRLPGDLIQRIEISKNKLLNTDLEELNIDWHKWISSVSECWVDQDRKITESLDSLHAIVNQALLVDASVADASMLIQCLDCLHRLGRPLSAK